MVYIFLAEGFEEIEALTQVDYLRRAGIDIKTVGVTGKIVKGSHGIPVTCDITEDEAYLDGSLEMIILPGGMPGTKNLEKSKEVLTALKTAFENGKYLSAICAAPSVLGKCGYLRGKKATCYPGFEDYLEGAQATGEKCVVDGKVITAKGAGAALDFAYAIIGELCGKERAEKIKNEIMAK